MSFFDLDNRYIDDAVVGRAITRRDGVFLSVVFHLFVLAMVVYGPEITLFQLSPEELERRRAAIERQDEDRTFVFVQPQVDIPAPKPRRAGSAVGRGPACASAGAGEGA